MADPTKLAKALGLKIYDQNRKDFYYLGKVAQCSIVRLADYLASPAGEKAVRDKVRELCPNGRSICYVYFPDLPLGHRLGIDIPGSPEFDCATEPEVYAAALIELAERGD